MHRLKKYVRHNYYQKKLKITIFNVFHFIAFLPINLQKCYPLLTNVNVKCTCNLLIYNQYSLCQNCTFYLIFDTSAIHCQPQHFLIFLSPFLPLSPSVFLSLCYIFHRSPVLSVLFPSLPIFNISLQPFCSLFSLISNNFFLIYVINDCGIDLSNCYLFSESYLFVYLCTLIYL